MESGSFTSLTGGQRRQQRSRGGTVSGYVFRLIREQLGRTQDSSRSNYEFRPTPSQAGSRDAVP